ncbi:MAG: hypothetical protein COU40_01785 [Candidatus Moranbacteria bacterium CG10_big_fil_rev_8_21_14_0_10_35_21]|nr:MAG: hypothetical protein COU40_01785 [Candidatus Moranbacteria bacterium CG10_big_fil_rev_8_21_14_0_10_35_21]PJA88967.1 MAG: hypothetical protein CO139_00285 [Candidatus Moranbacteria bacterium CG_4_9_14_3_um_filter_36_9]
MLIELGEKASIKIQEIEHSGYKIVYMSVIFNVAVKDDSQISNLFSEIYQQLKDKGIRILQEKIHGALSKRNRTTAIRNRLIKKLFPAENIIPFTFIEGAPCVGGIIAGIQIIGVIAKNNSVKTKTVFFGGESIGRILETADFKEIFLVGISGSQKRKGLALGEQAEHAFFEIKNILSSNGYKMNNVIRTWIYMPKILDWYAEFNKARSKCFQEFGLIGKNKKYLPASTGIQGKRNEKEEIFIDVLTLISKTSRCIVSVMKNTCQNEAREYGSLFSRGMAVKIENSETLYISGTASIDNNGKTVCLDDAAGQIAQTLKSIRSLLRTKKSCLSDIVIATAYCKNKKAYTDFKKFIANSKLKDIPFVPVYADICRDNLLFEIDAIAVKIK